MKNSSISFLYYNRISWPMPIILTDSFNLGLLNIIAGFGGLLSCLAVAALHTKCM